MTGESSIPASSLHALAVAVLQAAGCSAHESAVVAEHLVGANLRGHDSHGIVLLPAYMRNLKSGLLHPDAPLRYVRDEGVFMVADGGGGFGQRLAREVTDAAIARVRETGVVILALRNCHHMGRIGAYAEQCADAGWVSMFWVNVVSQAPVAAPHGGTDARLSTNPVTMGMPLGARAPVVLDFATTGVAGGKCRVAMHQGKSMPEGLLLDERGQPTRDPAVIYRTPRGCLLPVGGEVAGHKGAGLALMAELLAGGLSGGHTVQPAHPRLGAMSNNLFGIVFNPCRLTDVAAAQAEMGALIDYVKASPPRDPARPVQVAGEPERAAMEKRGRDGVPLDATTRTELAEVAVSLGLERGRVEAWLQ